MINAFYSFFSSFGSTDIPDLTVDLHSHLLPGLDDGAQTMEESIELILGLKALGFRKLIITPHVMQHRYANNALQIKESLTRVQQTLKELRITMELEAAAEYYLDEAFFTLLAQKELLTFGDNYLLFELSHSVEPVHLDAMIFQIQSQGYQPVLAHPERYGYWHHTVEKYVQLKQLGVLFQLDTNTLGTYYPAAVQKAAIWLVKNSMIDFVGTDTHSLRHIDALEHTLKSKNYRKLFKTNVLLNHKL